MTMVIAPRFRRVMLEPYAALARSHLVVSDAWGVGALVAITWWLRYRPRANVLFFLWNDLDELIHAYEAAGPFPRRMLGRILASDRVSLVGPFAFSNEQLRQLERRTPIGNRPLTLKVPMENVSDSGQPHRDAQTWRALPGLARARWRAHTVPALVRARTESRTSGSEGHQLVVYFGDLDLHRNEVTAPIDEELWRVAGLVLEGGLEYADLEGTVFGLGASPAKMLDIARNRVRFLYLQRVESLFPDRLIVVGDAFSTLGFKNAMRTAHAPAFRRQMYRRCRISIDLLSRSSAECIYPRSAEIISYGLGLLQLRGADSDVFYDAEQRGRRVFSSGDELESLVRQMFAMDEDEYVAAGLALRGEVDVRVREYNAAALRAAG